MVAGAYGHTLVVEYRAKIVGMNIVDEKRLYAGLLGRCANQL